MFCPAALASSPGRRRFAPGRTASRRRVPLRPPKRGKWWLVTLALTSWPCWLLATPQPGQIEVLKRGAEPESLIQFRPVKGASQKLAWEWSAQGLVIRGKEAVAEGKVRSVRGVWNVSTMALQEDGFSCRRSLSVSSSEPPHPAFNQGFSETVVKDLRGLTHSIETDRSVAKPFGMTSPWIAHRALDIVFPGEPVGMDAQWKVVRSLELDDGLWVDVEAIYELKQIAPDYVGIVYSLDVKRSPVPMKYARRHFDDKMLLVRLRLFVSVTCAGRAFQYLAGILPNEADLICQVIKETKRGNTWIGLAAGEQIIVRIRPG